MYNCFSSDTKLITKEGVKRFIDLEDGQTVDVLDKDGVWRQATAHTYGKGYFNIVKLKSGRTYKEITCSANHRWILKDGTITTNLRVGDQLALLKETELPSIDEKYFCLGFILGDGCDNTSESGGTHVRLCGDKIKYMSMFLNSGYKKTNRNITNGDVVMLKKGRPFKQDFIKARAWRFLSYEQKVSLFLGYYDADGAKNANSITTSNELMCEMIRDISALAGYHITSENKLVHDTPYKKDAVLYTFRFMKSQLPHKRWEVESITRGRVKKTYWCVEEPVTKSFTLEGGVVTGNCCLCNLEDILQNGTVISGTMIERPHSFSTACTITTQVVAQVSSNQYGGQSITLSHLVPFVDISRQTIRKQVEEEWADVEIEDKHEKIEHIVEQRLKREVEKGVQTINYQVQTLLTTNGQAPFLTVFLYLGEVEEGRARDDLALIIDEVLRQRLQGVKNEKGVWITQAFPKLIYVLEEDNITEDSKYWDLTVLSAKTTAKRLCPDYISEKIMKQLKVDENGDGHCYPTMGCRSILTPYVDDTGTSKYYGRFNQGVVTINLVDVACASLGNEEDFWRILDKRLEVCHEALLIRHKRLLGTPSDVAPILWQYGAIARLDKGQKIDKLLKNNYSTISLGYAGLSECVWRMKGCSHTTEEGRKFGLRVMQRLNDACAYWRYTTDEERFAHMSADGIRNGHFNESGLDYELAFSLYGTPMESTTYKFAKKLKERWGIIEHVTDRNYITNSYHIHVTEEIDAFDKLTLEAEFQKLSPGGELKYNLCCATLNSVKTGNRRNPVPSLN